MKENTNGLTNEEVCSRQRPKQGQPIYSCYFHKWYIFKKINMSCGWIVTEKDDDELILSPYRCLLPGDRGCPELKYSDKLRLQKDNKEIQMIAIEPYEKRRNKGIEASHRLDDVRSKLDLARSLCIEAKDLCIEAKDTDTVRDITLLEEKLANIRKELLDLSITLSNKIG